MNKQNQIGKEKAYLFYEMSLFADTIIYVKNHMESTPKKLLEQVSLVRLQDKRPNTGINVIFTSSEKLEIKVYKTILQHQKICTFYR